jgi:hypothetical protein
MRLSLTGRLFNGALAMRESPLQDFVGHARRALAVICPGIGNKPSMARAALLDERLTLRLRQLQMEEES